MIARAALVSVACSLPAAAQAQAYRCAIPRQHRRAAPRSAERRASRSACCRSAATRWRSPGPRNIAATTRATRRRAFQCGGGNRFGFTLHGLWPDGVGKDWPQYCARDRRSCRAPVIRATLCATPSAQLIQHEWAKHGTCMPGDGRRAISRARRGFRAAALSRHGCAVAHAADGRRGSPRRWRAANPGLPPDMIRVTATRQGWLDEVWLCLDTRFRYRALPGAARVALRPGAPLKIWRGER